MIAVGKQRKLMTDSGRAFRPLGDNGELETLCISNGVFDDVQDFGGLHTAQSQDSGASLVVHWRRNDAMERWIC